MFKFDGKDYTTAVAFQCMYVECIRQLQHKGGRVYVVNFYILSDKMFIPNRLWKVMYMVILKATTKNKNYIQRYRRAGQHLLDSSDETK